MKGGEANAGPRAGEPDMTLVEQSELVWNMTWLLYIIVPLLIAMRRRIVTAGLVMLAITFLPMAWQIIFTHSDAPGFMFLLIAMLPVSLLLIGVGLILKLVRLARPGQRPQA